MKKFAAFAVIAVFAAISFIMAYFKVFGAADKFAEDVLYHHASGTSAKIKIIKIDDKSIGALGDYASWNRGIYADLVDTLCVSEDIRPAVIGFDILFADDFGSEEDMRFAEACRRHGNVVCAYSYVFERDVSSDEYGNLSVNNLSVSDTVLPYPALYGAARHGFVNALMDSGDGLIRNSFVYFPYDGKNEPSFNSEVYGAYCEKTGTVPEYAEMMKDPVISFRYSGKPYAFENLSLCDVLDGSIPPEAFDGCIVLVGTYTAGMMDAYYVPVDRGQQMFGVEIHANVIEAFMDGKFLKVIPAWQSAVTAAVLAAVLALVCRRMSAAGSVVCAASFSAVRLIIGYVLFNAGLGGIGISGDVLTFPVTAVLIAAYYVSMHYYLANRDKRQIEKIFKKYVSPKVLSKIAGSGTYELKLGGETRDVAVLFVDIRGFTPLSESLEPEQVVEILNSYLALTTKCILKHGGMLDKFVGDATMAVFNAPFDTEDYVYKAVLTAWDIIQGGEAIEHEFAEKFGRHVGFGVGVNCGKAVVGNIGCDFRMDYTAIGDTVNTAARLEANAPRGKVYISSAVYEKIKDRISVEEVGEIPLKGKSQGVFVYSVTKVHYESEKTENEKVSDNTRQEIYE